MSMDNLASKEIIDFLRIHEVDNGLLDKFKTRLQSITLVLNDAEEKQGKSQEVKAWRDELQDVVYGPKATSGGMGICTEAPNTLSKQKT